MVNGKLWNFSTLHIFPELLRYKTSGYAAFLFLITAVRSLVEVGIKSQVESKILHLDFKVLDKTSCARSPNVTQIKTLKMKKTMAELT